MRYLPFSIFCLLVLVVGCDSAETTSPQWQATLVGEAGFEAVNGSSVVRTEGGQTLASVNISGATPGAAHPWHVHIGSCATGGPIFGDAMAYPLLNVGAGGSATADATVSGVLQAGTAYFVNVHLSMDDLATIVACGDLTSMGPTGNPAPGNGDGY